MGNQRRKLDETKMKMQKYVRYKEGAMMYSMGQNKFEQLAKDANATYKIGNLVLVNKDIFERYLESFRIVE